ncbi:MAG: hypothetical protein A3J76_02995 [Candidatus Moranbacteria bacterium RBG_13_45_13]|nr:MAG: hypothetical protein A3J76_02995 [Candidatus Moranbacteria bacterium RBG_13_45_13]
MDRALHRLTTVQKSCALHPSHLHLWNQRICLDFQKNSVWVGMFSTLLFIKFMLICQFINYNNPLYKGLFLVLEDDLKMFHADLTNIYFWHIIQR